MLADERFARFLPQVTEYLGPVTAIEEPTTHGANRGFAVLLCTSGDQQVVSAVTSGLRFQDVTAILPQELCCTVLAAHVETAHRLIVEVAGIVLANGAGVQLDQAIGPQEDLVPGTLIAGVVCAPHPFVDEGFDVVRDAAGSIETQIITLIPATAAELELARAQGADLLFERWEEAVTDLADLRRESAV